MNLGGHGRADWENMTRLNPLLHEPSELPVMKTSPEQLTKGFASASLSKTLTNGVAFGALSTGPLSRAAPPPFCPQPLGPKRHCRRHWSARSPEWWRSPTPTDGVDPLVIKSTWISAPAAKALSSRYSRKASCNTNAPFVRRSLSNAQCFTYRIGCVRLFHSIKVLL